MAWWHPSGDLFLTVYLDVSNSFYLWDSTAHSFLFLVSVTSGWSPFSSQKSTMKIIFLHLYIIKYCHLKFTLFQLLTTKCSQVKWALLLHDRIVLRASQTGKNRSLSFGSHWQRIESPRYNKMLSITHTSMLYPRFYEENSV